MPIENDELVELLEKHITNPVTAQTTALVEFTEKIIEVNNKLTVILTCLQKREKTYWVIIGFLIVALVSLVGVKLTVPTF